MLLNLSYSQSQFYLLRAQAIILCTFIYFTSLILMDVLSSLLNMLVYYLLFYIPGVPEIKPSALTTELYSQS